MHNCAQDFIYDEVVDPDSKDPIEPAEGVEGALVYSSIDLRCYPLLRFYVEDHIKIATTDCECGYPGPTLEVIGRLDDMIKVRGVKVWPSAIKAIISTFTPHVTGNFRIVLEEKPLGFALRGPFKLRVEHGVGVSEETMRQLPARIASKITEALYFRPNSVEMVPPGMLTRSEFKAKYVEILP
jgi:phenylacetate-CoA ligase